ncbi:Anti-sigma regulatory factor (Ser/Thr protein kinase) [Thermomonospora echinospora]|uniref:Anti-sigma regulatory factor (Ser/Thr protein kinase) n=1 Tax=Thermomonospora echinospora TaxID=1992 RepID=A0A1H6DQC6_9ACTN|nr:ATP-binding protein [Thermomonospora echinospora]SEG87451.1 Anti-sigma regulatory factor (Ser/Thr protein kinase) [Thermomonospora echinospora]
MSGAGLVEGVGLLCGLCRVEVARFPSADGMVRQVRRWLRGRLAGTGVDAGDLDLIVAEIGGNAVLHTATGAPGGCLWVVVSVTRERVRLEFTDDGGAYTTPGVRGRPDESGRGLRLVAALAQDWGWRADATGRVTVWADLGRARARRCGTRRTVGSGPPHPPVTVQDGERP